MTAREGQDRHDPARGTRVGRDYDEVLRQALHAVADAIEPAGDGLTRIMRRLNTPWAVRQVALLVTDCIDLARLITIWLEPAFTGATRLRWRHDAGYRRELPHQPARPPMRRAGPWLRPALAVVGAVAIVVVAVVVLGPMRQIVARTSLNTGPGTGAPAHAGAHSTGGGHVQSPTASLTRTSPTRAGTTSAQAGRTSHRPGTTPTSSPAVTPSVSPAASPSQSPGVTPTPSKTHKPHPSKSKTPPGHNS